MDQVSSLSPLKLVNFALNNAREAGHPIDAQHIAVLWRIARGEASALEISDWAAAVKRQIASCDPSQKLTLDPLLLPIVARLDTNLRELERKLAELSATT